MDNQQGPGKFTYKLRAASGYVAEGTYQITPETYGDVVRVLEGSLKSNAEATKPAPQQPDPNNAHWLSLAHMACAEAGVPPGHIEKRLEQLRDLVQLNKLQFSNDAQQGQEPCIWFLEDDENGIWQAGCGQSWTFTDGGPKENKCGFCFSCGKPLVEAAQERTNG